MSLSLCLPAGAGGETTSLFFVGTATTILEWEGIRIMTDPNFLHAGDHFHLGPGVIGERVTNPAIDLHELPRMDAVLLSHYHADHFDQKVEASLRRSLPIITTPHAKELPAIQRPGRVLYRTGKKPAIKVTVMPGKHVPPGPLSVANDLSKAVPPTNGWMVELGYSSAGNDESLENGYRIYISGDTLMVNELKEIPELNKGQHIDLMLMHLGGTTIPSPSVPLLMVTMDAKQRIELVQLIQPDVTILIHYDDYNVFLPPLSDFKKAVEKVCLL
ncbi:Metallo-hydrolase/oxidoreductase [Cenococcum geophilum 1.58]|uniref:Metallo-hydrolase/oxidoreductase n=1 Tax=Cenococcum geophilum 1.58 TaxID=794803 RepID=UPI00358E71C7|nr:Metallo-hydrolase/oxidoreductase [Cenococcum geophilum 1.58]